MDIRAADTAAFNADVDIVVLELLGSDLDIAVSSFSCEEAKAGQSYSLLLEVAPLLVALDHETFEAFWVTHCGGLRVEL